MSSVGYIPQANASGLIRPGSYAPTSKNQGPERQWQGNMTTACRRVQSLRFLCINLHVRVFSAFGKPGKKESQECQFSFIQIEEDREDQKKFLYTSVRHSTLVDLTMIWTNTEV